MGPIFEPYVGTYEVLVNGYKGEDAETYTLNADGTAEWSWLRAVNYTGGPPGTKKTGSWAGHEGVITLTFKDETGLTIVEEYHDFRFKDRYLRKIELELL